MKHTKILIALSIVAVFCSCHSREIAYISDAERDTAKAIMEVYAATILPGDQLYIYVESTSPESVIPFNQETHTIRIDTNAVAEQTSDDIAPKANQITTEVSGYNVTERGTIDFPILGKLDVVGITQDSLCRLIERRLKDEGYVKNPVVTTRLMNFRVTVVGEVRNPQLIYVNGTRLTILEALAICGDITDYGRRDNLTIVRSDGKQQEITELDLTKREMLDSPFYYLHNNDIVYVEPISKRKRIADRNPDVPKYISIGVNVLSILRTNISRIIFERRY